MHCMISIVLMHARRQIYQLITDDYLQLRLLVVSEEMVSNVFGVNTFYFPIIMFSQFTVR